jgi:hypothetical protein
MYAVLFNGYFPLGNEWSATAWTWKTCRSFPNPKQEHERGTQTANSSVFGQVTVKNLDGDQGFRGRWSVQRVWSLECLSPVLVCRSSFLDRITVSSVQCSLYSSLLCWLNPRADFWSRLCTRKYLQMSVAGAVGVGCDVTSQKRWTMVQGFPCSKHCCENRLKIQRKRSILTTNSRSVYDLLSLSSMDWKSCRKGYSTLEKFWRGYCVLVKFSRLQPANLATNISIATCEFGPAVD